MKIRKYIALSGSAYNFMKLLKSFKLLRLSEDLPIVIVIELVDTEENLNRILPFLNETVKEGLVTMEKVKIIKYRHADRNA